MWVAALKPLSNNHNIFDIGSVFLCSCWEQNFNRKREAIGGKKDLFFPHYLIRFHGCSELETALPPQTHHFLWWIQRMCITVNVWTGCQGILVWCLRVPTAPYHLNPLTAGFYLIKLLPFLSLTSVVSQVYKSHRRFGLKKSQYKHFHILLTLPDTAHSSSSSSSGHSSQARYHVHSIDGVPTKFRKHFRRRKLLICRKYWQSANPRLEKRRL